MEVLRGCRVRSRGTLDFSPTGYYPLDMYRDVQVIESVGKCERQSAIETRLRSATDSHFSAGVVLTPMRQV